VGESDLEAGQHRVTEAEDWYILDLTGLSL
jgi:hypothetical protein